MNTKDDISDGFSRLISQLTLNSRPIITELTILSERNLDQAQMIVDLVESRIKDCLPAYKLFSFYLVDSICKNVGSPYNVLFAQNLVDLFQRSYQIVGDETRQKLINLFKTWVHAKTRIGLPLFPPAVIKSIEEFLIKVTAKVKATPVPVTVFLTPAKIMIEIESLIEYVNKLNEFKDKNSKDRFTKLQYLSDMKRDIMQFGIHETQQIQDLQMKLLEIRKGLDYQGFEQRKDPKYIKNISPKVKSETMVPSIPPNQQYASDTQYTNKQQSHHLYNQANRGYRGDVKINESNEANICHNIKPDIIIPPPNRLFLSNITQSIKDDPFILQLIQNFGISRINEEKKQEDKPIEQEINELATEAGDTDASSGPESNQTTKLSNSTEPNQPAQNIFGIDVAMFNSMLSKSTTPAFNKDSTESASMNESNPSDKGSPIPIPKTNEDTTQSNPEAYNQSEFSSNPQSSSSVSSNIAENEREIERELNVKLEPNLFDSILIGNGPKRERDDSESITDPPQVKREKLDYIINLTSSGHLG